MEKSNSKGAYNALMIHKGNLKAKVGDEEKIVKTGSVIHIPANSPHSTVATPEGDALYYVTKDTSWGIAGDAEDGKKTGPHYEPGFEPKN